MRAEIVPSVTYLPGAGNMYICAAPTSAALIDTGMRGRVESVFDALRALGYEPAQVTHIVITHADIDHAGRVAALQAGTGARVHASAATAEYLVDGRSPDHLPRPAQFILNRFLRYPPLPREHIHLFADGDVLPVAGGLQVLATPGHTPDHHSLFSPSLGVLFAGDALDTRRGRVKVMTDAITADKVAAATSALRLLALNPAVIACGHGEPLHSHEMRDMMVLARTLRARLGQ